MMNDLLYIIMRLCCAVFDLSYFIFFYVPVSELPLMSELHALNFVEFWCLFCYVV